MSQLFSGEAVKLSILICSLESRSASLFTLLETLRLQRTPDVDLITDIDNGEASIGAKRNRLLNRATADYVCFIDDDDKIPADYVSQILAALETSPDCVGFNLAYYVDGKPKGTAIHSLRYERYAQHKTPDGMLYERTPNHLNPIRREIALQAGFTEKNHGEDTDFAVKVRPLLKTEVFIDQVMYHYFFDSKK